MAPLAARCVTTATAWWLATCPVSTWALPEAGVNAPASHEGTSWRAQAWGEPAPRYRRVERGSELAGACGTAVTGAMLFSWTRERDAAVDLVLPQMLQPAHAYRVTLRLKSAGEPVDVDLHLRRQGAPYDSAIVRTLRATREWQAFDLQGVYLQPEPGAVRLSPRSGVGSICIGETVVEPIERERVGLRPAPQPVPDDFFGVHLNQLGRHAGWPAFTTGLVRLWDSGTTWADLQPLPAPAAWSVDRLQRADYYVSHVRAHDARTRLLFTLGFTPAWAAGAHDDCRPSSYGVSSCRAPADLQAWRQYVRTLALRYRGRITHWELWNEADMPFHWHEPAEALVPLARAAAQELKSVDPANRLIGPNITAGGIRFLNDFLRAGGGAHVDGLSVHAYFGRTPEGSADQVRNVLELQRQHGLGLPVWNTESNVSCNDSIEACGGGRGSYESRLAAPLALVRGVISQASAGVRSITYYTWEGASQEDGGVGLVDEDRRTPSEAGRAMKAVVDLLRGATVTQAAAADCPRPDRMVCIEVARAASRVMVVWSTGSALFVDRARWARASAMRPLLGAPTWLDLPPTLTVGAAPVLLRQTPR